MNNFKFLGLSYKNTPLEIRELIALSGEACGRLLSQINEFTNANDVLVLSTCNRTEIYYDSADDISNDLIKLIGIQKGISNISSYKHYFNILDEQDDAVNHLFEVALGLDAQVVGDMQITNQVKQAYQLSADLDMAGPFLHRLMHTIFFTNKRVVQETPFRDGAASVSYATVEMVEELTRNIHNPKVLILGLGEMGADVCRNLPHAGIGDVYITNRTFSKAQQLADEMGFYARPFDEFPQLIEECDLIVSSIGSDEPVITKNLVDQFDILSFKYMIDMSVPRSIEKDVEQKPGVILYNIDNIQNKTNEAVDRRLAAIPDVKAIMHSAIHDFNQWTKEMEVSPTIQRLKNALEQIRQEEIDRYIKQLSNDESQKIDKITKNIMQKIIKLPVLQLKAACKRGEAETLIDVLNDVFNLEEAIKPEDKKVKK